MDVKKAAELLALFGIKAAGGTREILARLVSAQSLSLGELQTARDIVSRRAGACDDGAAYLFLAAMFISRRGGNAFLRTENGASLVAEGCVMADAGGEGNEKPFSAEDAWLQAEKAARALDGDVIFKKPDACGERWFFKKDLRAVEAVSQSLMARVQKNRERRKDALSPEELAAATSFSGFRLNERQAEAVKKAASGFFTVVSGGPGTGKTTVVFSILRALASRGIALDTVALAAPTGRAAQRLVEALQSQCENAKNLDGRMKRAIESLSGSTVHSLLGGRRPRWKYGADRRIPLGFLVVDESSMVDLHLMNALLAALPDDCRIVLLGDMDQLPSVDTGAVLGDIVGAREADFVVNLTESKRFTGSFASCASAVNTGDAARFAAVSREVSSRDTAWLETFDSDETANMCCRCMLSGGAPVLQEIIQAWASHYGLMNGGRLSLIASDAVFRERVADDDGAFLAKAGALFDELERSRILTVVREGPFGAHGINEFLLKMRFDGRIPRDPLSVPGVPVMVTRNTPSRGLFNGDVGVTIKGASGMTALFPRGKKVVKCPVGLLPEHETAYAMTVHKSQGSEFENVFVVLPDRADHPLLNRQIVYTGITRAKKRAVVASSAGVFAAALAKKLVRDTGIDIWNGAAGAQEE